MDMLWPPSRDNIIIPCWHFHHSACLVFWIDQLFILMLPVSIRHAKDLNNKNICSKSVTLLFTSVFFYNLMWWLFNIHMINTLDFWFNFVEVQNFCGVIDTAVVVSAVSLTSWSQVQRFHWQRGVKLCRVGLRSIIDTAWSFFP